jgi:hypothetical protein
MLSSNAVGFALGQYDHAKPLVILQPLKYPLGSMPLLSRSLLVIFQNGIDQSHPWPQLRQLDRLLSLVAWRHSVLQHLP